MNTLFFISLLMQVSQPAKTLYHFSGSYSYPTAVIQARNDGMSDTVTVVDCYKQGHRLFFAQGNVYCQDHNAKGWGQVARLNEVGMQAQSASIVCWQDSIAVEYTARENDKDLVCRRAKVVGRLWGHVLVISPIK